MKRQKVDDGPKMPELVPAVDLSWLPGIVHIINCKAVRSYRWYHGFGDGDEIQLADVPVDVVDNSDNIFAQEAL